MTFFVDAPFMNVIYEMVSALGTVGLTAGISGSAGVAGKILLILCMYLGRIGPISLALAFQRKHSRRDLDYPEQNITIG